MGQDLPQRGIMARPELAYARPMFIRSDNAELFEREAVYCWPSGTGSTVFGSRIRRVALTIAVLAKIENVRDRVCERAKGALADARTIEPVVLDEPEHRGLIV
jgi:hypothetical protein